MKNFTFFKAARSFFMLCCLLAVSSLQAKVIYVNGSNPSEDRDGTSWATAFRTLETALSRAAAGDDIWVAKGTYIAAAGQRFNMKSGVRIYGGFAGSETNSNERNWKKNPAILQDNGSGIIVSNNNVNSSAVLDGFTLTPNPNSSNSPRGMENMNSSPQLQNIVFLNNPGGGLLNEFNSSPSLYYVTFKGNGKTNYSTGEFPIGGIWNYFNSSPLMQFVVFENNTTTQGAGFYNESSDCKPRLIDVVFSGNTATAKGGAIYAAEGVLTIFNAVFYNNKAGISGGAVYGSLGNFNITNSTFASNSCTANGASIYNGDYGTAANCIFWNNLTNGSTSKNDIFNDNTETTTPLTVSYSYLQSSYSGTGNVVNTASPFVNGAYPKGADSLWMTPDDGLELSLCASAAIDHGNNNALNANLVNGDIAGNFRHYDVPLVTDGGSGTAPIIDMGAYENTSSIAASEITGTIGNAHIIPKPQELIPDYVSSITAPIGGSAILWQQTFDTAKTWTAAATPNDSVAYRLPPLTTTTYYRRVAAFCNTAYPSNIVQIKVVLPTGAISGGVVNKNGFKVKGINIQITRLDSLSGGPSGYKYPDTTTSNAGTFKRTKLYIGDPSIPSNDDVSFVVRPYKTGHGFEPDSAIVKLNINNPVADLGADYFIDTTALGIRGITYQTCNGCTTNKYCPLDSVQMYRNGSYFSSSTVIDGQHGTYVVIADNPGDYTISPKYHDHVFDTTSKKVTVTGNVDDVNFYDTTTHVISGYLTAGCQDSIGTAVLEFTDVLPKDKNSPQISCFVKRVTTGKGGFYSIRLPARKYKASVYSFVSDDPSDIPNDALITFINNLDSASLTRDITDHDTTMNLTYHRKPQIVLSNLKYPVCDDGETPPGLLPAMQQSAYNTFKVNVYEGDPSLRCVIKDTSTKIIVRTNVTSDQAEDSLSVPLSDTGAVVTFAGALPNIAPPFTKYISVYYTDKYKQTADTKQQNVVVTGLVSEAKSFVTVSPEVPLMVLHDPPGDQSYSSWSQGTTLENAVHMYAADGMDIGGWLSVKLGTDVHLGLGVSTETKVWGTISGTANVSTTNTTSDEAIISSTTTTTISTGSGSNEVGDDADRIYGGAINVKYAIATEVYFDSCAYRTKKTMAMSDSGFQTTYFYSVGYVKNTLLPKLEEAKELSSRPDIIQNQIKVWQRLLQTLDDNKRNATFDKNLSFNGGAEQSYSSTSDTTAINTIEYSMVIDAGVAAELGFEAGGSGVSGGVNVNFKMDKGGSTTNTKLTSTTTAYTLSDSDNKDLFSVNVSKDPVYHSPVFTLVGGATSCPAEPHTLQRDKLNVIAPVSILTDIQPGKAGIYTINITNVSANEERRVYYLSFVEDSNPEGAEVKIGGNSNPQNIAVDLKYLETKSFTVTIAKGAREDVYSYQNLEFRVTDDCDDDAVAKSVFLTANFASPCSSLTLALPSNNWTVASADNNILPVKLTGYTVSELTSITLQYKLAGINNWLNGPAFNSSDLGTTQFGTDYNWNVSGLADGSYSIRAKLLCASGIIYSSPADGTIDRVAPRLVGLPEPADNNYVRGDLISFTYDENIRTDSLTSIVSVQDISAKVSIPFTVSGYNNQLVIVPTQDISSLAGDTVWIIVKGIQDLLYNTKLTPDTLVFTVGTPLLASGPRVLNLNIQNPVVKANSSGTIDISFILAAPASHNTLVNYSIAGTASANADYTAILPADKTAGSLNNFSGVQGSIIIDSGKTTAVLKIDPTASQLSDGSFKTVVISLLSGGNYVLGDSTSETGVIVYDTAGVLPVTLVSFSAKLVDNKTNLQWQTANETNTSYFIVERSTDGIHFSQVGKTGAKGSGSNRYAATDANLVSGNNYYRLKTVDKDGRYLYSKIVLINYTVSGLHIVNVSPSPVTGTKATVNIASDKTLNLKLIVLDVVGRQMNITPVAVQTGMNHAPVSFPSLSSGMYFLYAVDNSGRKSNIVQFVKQ